MNSTTNIVVVVILVLLVGFGVWYFTKDSAPQNEGPSLEVNLSGGNSSTGY